MTALLDVTNLTIFYGDSVKAVDDVSFAIGEREVFGLIGESGSGKSTIAKSLLGLVPTASGKLDFAGRDLAALQAAELRSILGRDITIVPQDSMSSLNPYYTIGRQLSFLFQSHAPNVSFSEGRDIAKKRFRSIGLDESVLGLFPHQLSGGMRQRVCIASALLMSPKLVIADEPTSALDVVSQRRVIELLAALQRESGFAMLFVGHDIMLMAQLCDRIGVLKDGKLVEVGEVAQIVEAPTHTYTASLIESVRRSSPRSISTAVAEADAPAADAHAPESGVSG